MAAPRRVITKRRATITALPLYHSGALLKKYTGEKDFKKYYGELRGSTIFLYMDETQDTYTEKLDLHMLKSMEMDSPYVKTPTIFTLSLINEEVQLKMECPDKGEEWRGFIMTVANKEIPSKMQLLPGQIERLKQVLYDEKERLFPQTPPDLSKKSFIPCSSFLGNTQETDSPAANPPCFFDVSRQEAERMLTENPEYGNIIIRPSTSSYAVTLRQDNLSGPVFKNYRVLPIDRVLVIELDPPVTVHSLRDVLDHFLKETKYRLRPYVIPQVYDNKIEVPPMLDRSTKPVPHARVAPMIHTQTACADMPPTTPPPDPPCQTSDNNGEYIKVDVPSKPSTRPAKVDEELRTILKARRENLYKAGSHD
ncbi:signal-transducing adaptor protein 1-like isoform X2 [Hypomesus transpacificus]|uniref:signal-transducing adaptor protein 1-like isoform X2 n=1 Tax=Hypomesus transpacificus TaxID=137520 RepID=UPI001F07D43C|nr:signal-transducing adaptor protein 1-like isoform X2 [Hypomesus transpacificus]